MGLPLDVESWCASAKLVVHFNSTVALFAAGSGTVVNELPKMNNAARSVDIFICLYMILKFLFDTLKLRRTAQNYIF